MEFDKYKVKILYCINPHLIWVLSKNENDADGYFYEQIGIYGILPLDIKINFDGSMQTKRSEEWSPAVTLTMQSVIADAVEVWFSVTYLDRTTSIFDNNLHKYGDLFIKMKNGKTLSMREELLDRGFVEENFDFYQHLKTKLDYITTVNVINKIKQAIKHVDTSRYLENLLKNQTSVASQIIEIEEVVTVHNQDKQLLLRKHMDNLNACKDVDEPSAGRANNPSKSTSNMILLKKINLVKSQGNSVVDAPSLPIKNESTKNNTQMSDENQNMEFKEINEMQWTRSSNININIKGKKIKTEKSDKAKKYMALGPPGLNPSQYHFKEVRKEKEVIPEKVNVTKITKEEEIKEDIDDFDNVDSEVNISIDDSSRLNDMVDISNKSNDSDLNTHQKNSFSDELNFNRKNHVTNRKLKYLKQKIAKMSDSSSTAETDSAVQKGDDSDSESITSLVNKLDLSNSSIKKEIESEPELMVNDVKNNVNPFKNLDGSKSVFVDKLISPTVMVHTKNGNRIQPVSNLRDIPFGTDIHVILQNMLVKKPMRPQTVSWPTILRGHSLFLVSPCGSGKTIGYLPAVCRLINNYRQSGEDLSVTPLSCIIVCATAKSVSHIEELCKIFLHNARIFACYTGMTDVSISTSLLNGCDILISTPTLLVRLMRDNLGIDLRNLNTFVIDDCERIEEVYQNELKFCLFKVKEMLKSRANKEVKVQYVVASRIWCDFMSSLAKKAPDSVVCIAAFQECVLYSKVDTSIELTKKEYKLDALIKFLQDIDKSKKTVIVCRSDDEVHLIEKMLTSLKYIVFACDSNMTVHDLYSLDLALGEYQEPILGLVLVCCDSNLTHLNVTDAHYLIHFSLPLLFSMFCKRFAVLSDNYQSIFNKQDLDVKVKILLEDSNVEQLPKILNFIKRCSKDDVPTCLDKISDLVMVEKDMKKGESFVPLCNALLTLGKCPDIWNCRQRHALFQAFDEPKPWLPKEGVITFKILHYHSAVHYSARMISCTTENRVQKYNETYNTITFKLGMYYSKESNRKLHGRANPGDICGVSLKSNLFARCKVIKILKYTQSNLPSLLLINLIDEEKYEIARDSCLFYLPDELKNIDSHAVQVILSNIAPGDRDITYSKIAENQLKKITETNEEVYMRGNVSLVIGNCIFVESLEACQNLSSLNETVIKRNFRTELLEGHAINNPNHLKALQKLGENLEFMGKKDVYIRNTVLVPKPIKILPKAKWAHLESDMHVPVYYLYAKNPGLFFVQHVKFQDLLKILIKDIKKYVAENPDPITDVKEGDIVLAEFPDDKCYERARIDSVIDNNKVKCFFVDLGDWAVVSVDKLLSVTEKIVTQLPFQAIECRLVGIKPMGDNWSDFATTWLVDQFYDTSSNLKYLFVKRFTKEQAEFTEGNKYGIGLIDTYADDVYINKLMIDANLAEENEEIELLSTIDIGSDKKVHSDDSDYNEDSYLADSDETNETNANVLQSECKKNNTSTTGTKKETAYFKENITTHTNDKYVQSKLDEDVKDPTSTLDLVKFENKENESNSVNVIKPIDNQDLSTDSTKDTSKDEQTIMNLFRRTPLRSVPLVEDDDIDDDKWDSINPLLMMTNPQGSTSTAKNLSLNESKIVFPAISYSKVDTEQSLEEQDVLKYLDDKTTQYNAEKVENTATPISMSKFITDAKFERENKLYYTISQNNKNILLLRDEISPEMFKKLKLTWRQDNQCVNLKINVSIKRYELNIKDKMVQFLAKTDNADAVYGFELELYGAVDAEKCVHSNKGTYIEINFIKVISKSWLALNIGKVKKITMNDIVTKDIIEIKNANEKLGCSDSPKTSYIKKNESKKTEKNKFKKPKLLWRQNRHRVTIKIQLITDEYDLSIKDKHLQFYACANDEEYGFDIELNGVVDVKKSLHSNKGQYVLVNLCKVMPKIWFTLNEGVTTKWIVYDVDGIDVSSEDEKDSVVGDLRNNLNINAETETEDDFDDDIDFTYKKNY